MYILNISWQYRRIACGASFNTADHRVPTKRQENAIDLAIWMVCELDKFCTNHLSRACVVTMCYFSQIICFFPFHMTFLIIYLNWKSCLVKFFLHFLSYIPPLQSSVLSVCGISQLLADAALSALMPCVIVGL